jgi:putative ABC transport system permease protein
LRFFSFDEGNMERINIFLARLRALFRRESVIDDIDEEMRLHIEMDCLDDIGRGMSPEEARALALRRFGNLTRARDVGFESRGGMMMDMFWQDLRYGFRMFAKHPGSTLVAVLTLALGIGATAAVFSLIQGVLLTPPPYKNPERLVLISPARTDGQQVQDQQWPAAQWMEWQKEAKSFKDIGAFNWTFNFLVLPDGSRSMEGMVVTEDYFRVLGLQPLLGRCFPENPKPDDSVVVLGYDLWQQQFNGDPNIVGKTIQISRYKTPPTVIGVMPRDIRFLPSPGAAREPNYNVNAKVDFFVPVVPDPAHLKDGDWDVVARLADGAPVSGAQSELSVLVQREVQSDHDFQGIAPQVEMLRDESNRDGRRILLPLLGAAVLVLLIACGNAAALLLVRGLSRQQEYAVRTALGAGRGTLFRQVSTESLLLALLGGAAGVGLALGIVKIFKLIGGHAIPRLDAVTAGWPVLLCGLAAAILAAAVAGLFPALRASRLDPMQVINSAGPKSSAGRGERRLLRSVVMTQTALTLVLLVGAGLLIRTMKNLANVRAGYDIEHTLTMSVTDVDQNSSASHWRDFHKQALERVSRLPGVEHAAFAWGVPLTGNNWPGEIEIEGQPPAENDNDRVSVPLRAITEDYFNLLGLSITEGREFRTTDGEDKAPEVVIVNQSLADRYFPNHQALGKKLWLGGRKQPSTDIIGVVTNSRTDDLTRDAGPEVYLPLWHAQAFSKHLVLRTSGDPKALIVSVEQELHAVDPTVAIENVKTLDEIRNDSQASRIFAMRLLVGFSVVASILALVGIYGVLSLSVEARRREIAIRTAVGARRQDVLKLVLSEGLRLVGVGVIAGLVGAIAFSRVLSIFLFGVKPTDLATLIGMGLLFACVALLASWVPARRASKVDPIVALRYE